ncbi:peptidylprolyl isomerase [Stakelama tenebrarum]|uniref:Peptidyl-prolyl cis-trans isomerase n=1 Tax=Stakelama tenebrarum TaxID=2711215 RepID=A0A6G6Y8J9_9SPHN|nr:peptidylprolyl isomerase [Sphingosinithalassobacter tenebrarum]QIG81127.1 peptidylprolyl isomerase [Sphingosinithalassobacter tenebrarum]
MRIAAMLLAFLGLFSIVPASAQTSRVVPSNRPEPPSPSDPENLWLLDLSTGGRVTIWLRPDVAPETVERIKTLTREKFYDGLTFHRVIEGFMAQSGDPEGTGQGGSELPDVKAEFNYLPHVRGAVGAAREGAPPGADEETRTKAENSANSQFYIMFAPRLSLDRDYTVFGRVIDGMEYVDTITRGQPPANPTRILHAWIAADDPPAYQPPAPRELPEGEERVTLPGAE